jgi:hypothetical protein
LGQTRLFALVELDASFTLTSRHLPRQLSRRTRADAADVRSLSTFCFLEKIADGRVAIVTPVPTVDGARSGSSAMSALAACGSAATPHSRRLRPHALADRGSGRSLATGHGNVVAWMASLCIPDGDLILQELLTRC